MKKTASNVKSAASLAIFTYTAVISVKGLYDLAYDWAVYAKERRQLKKQK